MPHDLSLAEWPAIFSELAKLSERLPPLLSAVLDGRANAQNAETHVTKASACRANRFPAEPLAVNDKGRYRSHRKLRCDAVLSPSPALGRSASDGSRATWKVHSASRFQHGHSLDCRPFGIGRADLVNATQSVSSCWRRWALPREFTCRLDRPRTIPGVESHAMWSPAAQ
jgi:hypothetical protein